MPMYQISIRQGLNESNSTVGLANDEAAKQEARSVCVDLIRDTMGHFSSHPDWRIAVSDEAGKAVYDLKISSETVA